MVSASSTRPKDVIQALKELGLEPRRRTSTGPRAGSGEPSPRRARRALVRLGPLWAAFGAYLGTRTDLLPLRACIELARTDEDALPIAHADLRAVLAPVQDRILVDEEMLHCTWMYQWHRGTTLPGSGDWSDEQTDDRNAEKDPWKERRNARRSGARIIVKVVRPDLQRQLVSDGDALGLLSRFNLCDDPHDQPDLRQAARDFIEHLERRLDLRDEARALARLKDATEITDAIVVPRTLPAASGRKVLARELIEGTSLAEVLAGIKLAGITSDAAPAPRDPDLARRLLFSWLHLALLGGVSLQGFDPADLVTCRGGRIGIVGGSIADHDRKNRDGLLEYLVRAAHHEPDRCYETLLDLVEDDTAVSVAARQQLRIDLRQAAPFRSGGWTEAFSGERLAPTLFVHWRSLHRAGGRPGPALHALQQGLTRLELLTRRIEPGRDALEAALADLRLAAAAVRLREELGPSRLRRNAVRLLTAVDSVARRAERIVSRRTRPARPAGHTAASARWLVPAGILASMATIALLWQRAVDAGSVGGSEELAAAVAFLGLTVALIRAVENDGKPRHSRRDKETR